MTSKIEQTKRDMYSALDRIRRAKKHRKMTDEFESALEAHLQALNAIADQAQQDAITARQDGYDLQRRMQAVDHSYFESQKLLMISGEELQNAQQVVGFQKTEIAGLRSQLEERDSTIGKMRKDYGRDRQDLLEAEKLSDELDEKLRDAQSVIGKQEQTIVGQRLAIADLFMQVRGMKP